MLLQNLVEMSWMCGFFTHDSCRMPFSLRWRFVLIIGKKIVFG